MLRVLLGLLAVLGGGVGGYWVLGGLYDTVKYLVLGGKQLGVWHPATILLCVASIILLGCTLLAASIVWDGIKLIFYG
jgi:hypothetical protein